MDIRAAIRAYPRTTFVAIVAPVVIGLIALGGRWAVHGLGMALIALWYLYADYPLLRSERQ
ncbi:MAG: hypothetical protein ACM31L_20110 [Actinomycetota bacterium]